MSGIKRGGGREEIGKNVWEGLQVNMRAKINLVIHSTDRHFLSPHSTPGPMLGSAGDPVVQERPSPALGHPQSSEEDRHDVGNDMSNSLITIVLCSLEHSRGQGSFL